MSAVDASESEPIAKWIWVVAVAAGAAVWAGVGWLSTGGDGEIAAIFTGAFVTVAGVFRSYRKMRWFLAVLAAWVAAHVAVLMIWILPLHLEPSKGFIPLFWVDAFGLFGLTKIGERVWGGIIRQGHPRLTPQSPFSTRCRDYGRD